MAIFTAIGTAIAGALFAGSALAGQLIAAGLSIAAQVGLIYLNRPKQQTYTAVQGDVQIGASTDALAVFGYGAVKGQRVYYAKYGAGNAGNAFVYRLAQGWCDGLEPYVYFHGKKHNLIEKPKRGNEAARYWVEGFAEYIEFRFYDGRPGQTVDQHLVDLTAGLDRPWSATASGTNVCYITVEHVYDPNLFEQGVPEYTWVLRGLREYDPRKDSTVPGGSGSHRWDDPATFEWTENPAIHRLNYQLGVRGVVSGRAMIGRGYEPFQIDMQSHMVAANVCDALRTVGQVQKPTYIASLLVESGMDHIEIEREFEDAMAGYAVPIAGLSGVIAGAPQVPVMTIEARHIRTNAPKSYSPSRNTLDAVNVLSGQYTEPSNEWGPEALTTISVNADITEDGRKLQSENDFLQVPDADVAQYLLTIRYRQNRLQKSWALPVTRECGQIAQLGSWVLFEGDTWLVTGWSFDAKFQFSLTLSQTSADIYDDSEIQPGPVVLPRPAPINPSVVRTLSNFTVTAGVLSDNEGYQTPTLEFAWDNPGDPTITGVAIRYREAGSDDVFQLIEPAVVGGLSRTSGNILPGRNYEAQADIITDPQRLTIPTQWVTTATATSPVRSTLAQTADDVRDVFGGLYADIYGLFERVEELAESSSFLGLEGIQERRAVREQVGRVSASLVKEELVRATADEAIVGQVTTLEARVETTEDGVAANAATIQTVDQARADGDSALASSVTTLDSRLSNAEGDVIANASTISATQADVSTLNGVVTSLASDVTAVEARTDDATASGLFKMEVQAGSGNVLARIVAFVRATVSDVFEEAGYSIEIVSDGGSPPTLTSFFVVGADRFIIDGEAPFSFDSNTGELVIQQVRSVGMTVDGLFSTADGRHQFGNFGNGVGGLRGRY